MTEYEIIKSDRKTISIQIKPDGSVIVRTPKRMKSSYIEAFVKEKESWIQKHLGEIEKRKSEKNHAAEIYRGGAS